MKSQSCPHCGDAPVGFQAEMGAQLWAFACVRGCVASTPKKTRTAALREWNAMCARIRATDPLAIPEARGAR